MSKRASSDGVIDLTFSDDEDEGKSPAAAASVSRLDDIRKKLHSGGRHRQKKAKTSSMMGGIGNGDDDDEVEIIKTEGGSKSTESIDYADVEVVQAPTATMELASVTEGQDNTSSTNSGDNGEDDDDDLVMIGTKNELRLPHMRPHCTKFKFQFNPSPRSSQTNDNNKNSDHCDLCYCYVCDCPVKDCKVSISSVLFLVSFGSSPIKISLGLIPLFLLYSQIVHRVGTSIAMQMTKNIVGSGNVITIRVRINKVQVAEINKR